MQCNTVLKVQGIHTTLAILAVLQLLLLLPRLVLATLHTISSSVHIQGLISAINAKQRIQSKFFLGFKKICSSHTDKKTWKLNPDIQALLMKNEKQAGRQAGRQVTRYNNAIATKMTTVARNRKRT